MDENELGPQRSRPNISFFMGHLSVACKKKGLAVHELASWSLQYTRGMARTAICRRCLLNDRVLEYLQGLFLCWIDIRWRTLGIGVVQDCTRTGRYLLQIQLRRPSLPRSPRSPRRPRKRTR